MTQQNKEKAQYLFAQLLEGKASRKEKEVLFQLLDENKDDSAWEEIIEELMASEALMIDYNKVEWQPVLESILNRDKDEKPSGGKIFHIRWMRWLVAAAVIGIIGVGLWFFTGRDQGNEIPVAVSNQGQDIEAPEVSRAMVTLSDGSQVYLDQAGDGQLANEGGIKLVKLADGQISYQVSPSPTEGGEQIRYNTLTNPRGSKVIDMRLSDGSRVWLNVGSSVTYPVAFIGNERKLTISGEAYFEVNHSLTASGAKQPFLVDANGVVTEVLGTHFNVNSYADEGAVKVTLLEGSIRVNRQTSNLELRPGQQALAIENGALRLEHVDVDGVIAWKSGMFLLDNTDLQAIMRQVSRWYDVDVVYAGKIPERRFGGGVSKNLPLSKILELLEANGIEFKLEGRKLIVLP